MAYLINSAPFRRRSGFTLIELLTVIAIIGILAAIIIPVVGKVRASARTAKCGSNLRQIGVALQLYLADHKDRFPPKYLDGSGASIFTWVGKRGTGGLAADASKRHLNSYLNITNPDDPCVIADCPDDTTVNGNYYRQGSSYSANLPSFYSYKSVQDETAPDPNRVGASMNDVAAPSRFLVMSEHGGIEYGIWGALEAENRHTWHKVSGNVYYYNSLFADGHVKLTPIQKGVLVTPAYSFDRTK